MTGHTAIDLARGAPTWSGTLYVLWIIYGRDTIHCAVLPGLLIPLAQLLTAPTARDES